MLPGRTNTRPQKTTSSGAATDAGSGCYIDWRMLLRASFLISALAVLGVAPVAQARPARGLVPAPSLKAAKGQVVTQPGRTAAASLEARVLAASVFLPARACTGVVVGSARVVATAAHCLVPGKKTTPLKFSDGSKTTARVAHVDKDRDVALLVTDQPSSVTPLSLTSGMPKVGTKLLFVGRPDRARARHTRVTRLGPCPGLPKLRSAAFTTLTAVPGDSGAPLVDPSGRVVALVHGGVRCHIAVPVRPLHKAFLGLPRDVRRASPSPGDPALPPKEVQQPEQHGTPADAAKGAGAKGGSAASAEGEGARYGPFIFERTKKGFRFSFSVGKKK